MRKKITVVAAIWLFGAVLIASGVINPISFLTGKKTESVINAGNLSVNTSEILASKETSSEDIQSKINKANKEKASIEAEKKQLKSDIAAIESKKDNVVEYIESLDKKLADLSAKIEKNKKERISVKEQIRTLKKEAKQAESDKRSQYDTMSKRIKYIYENGNDGYLELLLGSESLSELFNRAEYVSKVTNYDNQMLKRYQAVCKKLEESQKQLENKLVQLANLKESLKVEQESVNLLVENKTKELSKYQMLVADKNTEIASKNTLLKQQEEELEQLMAAQRKKWEAEEKAKKQEKKSDNSSSKNNQSNTSNNSSNNTQNNNSSNTANSGGYVWPLTVSGRISSYFGYRDAPTEGASTFHKGIDVAVPTGTGILATKSGTVVTSAYSSSAGNYVAVSHGDGVYSYYMHCSKLLVSEGDKVSKGQKIALSGNTGISTGPHLHFAIFANGSYVNPLNYVSQ